MSNPLAAYLAKNYLTADTPKPKKKKRKHPASSGLIIADDDATAWTTPPPADDDDLTPTIAGTSTSFRKAKSNWISTSASADSAAADAILLSNTDGKPRSPSPEILGSAADKHALKMSSGAFAGLQTAEQMEAQMAAAAREEARRFAGQSDAHTGKGQETIYRDASGRIINLSLARMEAQKAEKAEEEKRRKEREAQRGEVQKREEEKRREELKEAKYMTMARYKDDTEMNRELKEKGRWGDPGAGFIEGKKATDGYQGAAEPNRFGIRPGKRWDGVDRGNGFERKWFLAQNKKREIKDRRYTSQMDLD